jgi:hypothetical protein
MPVSLLRHIPLQVGAVMNRNPNSVLDVGCGFGIYGALLREYLDVWCAPCEYGEHRTASSSGTPLRPSTTSGWFRKVVADTGLDGVRFHDLRPIACDLPAEGRHAASRRLQAPRALDRGLHPPGLRPRVARTAARGRRGHRSDAARQRRRYVTVLDGSPRIWHFHLRHQRSGGLVSEAPLGPPTNRPTSGPRARTRALASH